MKRSKCSDEQIIFALRQNKAGTPAADVCRQLGVSEATFYNGKKKYSHRLLRQHRSGSMINGRIGDALAGDHRRR